MASPEQVQDSINMMGGGPFNLGPGQITDDSEMSMCLIWAIIESNKDKQDADEKELNTDIIAKWYKNWLESNPFDIANTTYSALLPLLKEPYAYAAKRTAAQHNLNSLSNASMMKLAPLAVWTSSLSSVEGLKKAVISDVEFIHSNELV